MVGKATPVQMQSVVNFLGVLLGTALIVGLLTKFLISWLTLHSIKALPEDRSMHKEPIPVGGGLVIVCTIFIAWIYFYWPITDNLNLALLAAMIVLASVSWLDDKSFVSPPIRLLVQILAVSGTLFFLPHDQLVFNGVFPVWLDRGITALCWLWFINLFNFMDGIDGISGVETLSICAGIATIGAIVGLPVATLGVATVIGGAAIGFLWWNWYPAKIFMGDVGSITLGFVLGWFLIQLAFHGAIIIALILPLYYLTDATLTLLRRIIHREKIWLPHKTHYYQRAAQNLQNHAKIVFAIAFANFVLLVAGLISIDKSYIGLTLALVVVGALMFHLRNQFNR